MPESLPSDDNRKMARIMVTAGQIQQGLIVLHTDVERSLSFWPSFVYFANCLNANRAVHFQADRFLSLYSFRFETLASREGLFPAARADLASRFTAARFVMVAATSFLRIGSEDNVGRSGACL